MRLFGTDVERITTRYGRLYAVGRDSVIGRSLKLYGEWAEDEIAQCAALLSDGDTIVDVGANIGTHSIAFASRFPASEIVAFEPQPLAFSLLSANLLAASAANVYPRNCGCAETERIVRARPDYQRLDWNAGAFSLSESSETDGAGDPMLLVPLDALRFEHCVQFIKIDVEGMEESVLAGARQLIARDRPILYFEVLEIARLAGPRRFLSELGYELRWLKSDAYNARNFRLNPENIWRRGETGVLALPSAGDARVSHLPLVTGDEAAVPVIEYPPS